MAPFIFEEDRPHLNEAALLSGTNPEIEALQDGHNSEGTRAKTAAPHDAGHAACGDVITSIGVYAKQPARTP